MWEFRLGNVMVSLGHGHGKEHTSKGGVNNRGRNLFNKRVKSMKVKYRQNPIWESCERHSQGYAEICRQVVRGRKGVVSLGSRDVME